MLADDAALHIAHQLIGMVVDSMAGRASDHAGHIALVNRFASAEAQLG